jgi:tRNA A-37 threonylcarbamoyl transferase component Bud32
MFAPMNALMETLQQELGEDFEFARLLGEGDFAEVFLARERALDRPVAIKVLRAALALDETARKRFLREARLAAKIHHPNVVSVYRVGELGGDGRPYVVMEYIDGLTFEDILAASGPLPEDEVRHVVGEVCRALDVAHALGIIHRDVRPGNIMRTRDGQRVVLTDFGLAGILETGSEAATRLTGVGQILGTVGHVPPEQLTGGTIRPGSDIYALAVTAYELLTGGGPFPAAKRPFEQMQAHLSGDPAPIRQLRPAVTEQMEELLLRCLQKRPDQRPTAQFLRARLTGASDGVPDGAAADAAERMPQTALEGFVAELKRRHVYKVGAGYGAFMLIVLAVVDGALPALPFHLPDWTDTAMVTAALAGFPLALIMGWFFDLTGRGVVLTRSAEGIDSKGLRVLMVAALVASLLLTAFLGWFFLLR